MEDTGYKYINQGGLIVPVINTGDITGKFKEYSYDQFIAAANSAVNEVKGAQNKDFYDTLRRNQPEAFQPGAKSGIIMVNGIPTQEAGYLEQQANASNPNMINIGTAQAPMYVPKDSAGAKNVVNFGTQNTAGFLPPTSETVGQGINLANGGNLQVGSNGDRVKQLQALLGMTGTDVDGVFGPKTQAAVKAFQTKNGLTADGIVGSSTNAALTKVTPGKVGTGINTPESLTSPTKIVVPPIVPGTDNATPYVASIQAAQDASVKAAEAAQKKTQEEYDSLSSTISGLLEKAGGQGQATLDAEKAAGIPEKQAAIDEINSQIQTKLAQYNALNVDAQGKAVTMNSIIGAQAQIKNVAAAEIGLLQAQVSAMEGKLKLAKDMADRAVELKYDDVKTQLDIRIKQLGLLKDTLTAKEKITADLLDKQYKAQTLALSTQISNEKAMNDAKLDQIKKYSLTGVSVNDSLETINAAVKKSAVYADEIRPPVGETANAGKSYTVSLGDVPESIASKLGLNVDTLLALNPGVNWNNLQKGQRLNADTSKLSSVKTQGELSTTDFNKGLNYVLLNGTSADVEAFKNDREYQAYILGQTK